MEQADIRSAVEVERGVLGVAGCDIEIPFARISGGDGPRFTLTAGVHADEYVGEQALIELAAELAALPAGVLEGCITLVPVVNVAGFVRRGTSMVPDGAGGPEVNLNRVFPGSEDGGLAERIAHAVFAGAVAGSDYYVDLHSGDYYEDLAPHLYYVADLPVSPKSRELAACTDVRIVVPCYETRRGGTYAAAAAAGVVSILLERGGMGAWSRPEVDAVKADVLNMLRYAGMLAGPVRDMGPSQYDFEEMCDLYAPCGGFWYPTRHSGECFAQDELLGQIRNAFGEVLHEVRAPKTGVVVYQTGSLNVVKDGPLIAYGLFA